MSDRLSHYAGSAFDGLVATGWQTSLLIVLVLISFRLIPVRLQKNKANRWRAFSVIALLLWPLNGAIAYSHHAQEMTALRQPHLCRGDGSCCQQRSEQIHLVTQHSRLKANAIGLWSVGAAGCGFFLLLGRRQLYRQLAGSSLSATCATMPAQLALSPAKSIPVLESARFSTPMTLGIFGRQIVLPQGLSQLLSQDELQIVLAHELAHAKRRDVFWSVLAAMIRSIFFFHPAFWIAERQLRDSQELTADELALQWTAHSPETFARLLLSSCQKLGGQPVIGSWQLGFLSAESLLRQRLQALLADHAHESVRPSRWVAVALSGLVCLLIEGSWSSAHSGTDETMAVTQTTQDPALAEPAAKVTNAWTHPLPFDTHELSLCCHIPKVE